MWRENNIYGTKCGETSASIICLISMYYVVLQGWESNLDTQLGILQGVYIYVTQYHNTRWYLIATHQNVRSNINLISWFLSLFTQPYSPLLAMLLGQLQKSEYRLIILERKFLYIAFHEITIHIYLRKIAVKYEQAI